jgi:hypothetical protein
MPLIFGLLVIINAVFLAWQFFEKQNANQAVVVQEQIPGIRLQLLSEGSATSKEDSQEAVIDKVTSGTSGNGVVCFRIGPLQDDDIVARLRGALVSSGFEVKVESFAQNKNGYWVYIPPQASHEKAQQVANELSSRGLDASVVSDPQFANAVALGTFQMKDQAKSLVDRLKEMGFQTEIREASSARQEQWLMVESAGSTVKAQIDRLISGTPMIRREPAACEN